MAYRRGAEYQEQKKAVGRPAGKSGQNVPIKSTAETVGEKHGVDAKTVKRDAQFKKAVDKIAETKGPQAKQEILSGKSLLTAGAVFGRMPTSKT